MAETETFCPPERTDLNQHGRELIVDARNIGVTFKVEGPIASPSLTVNPLSMITPGIFRKIFEFPIN